MNKMVINHLEKLFVTNDAATILRELEVREPHILVHHAACRNDFKETKLLNCF